MTTKEATLTAQQENDLLAAELALGLLTGEDEEGAMARAAQDVEFAKSVLEWQERLAGVADGMTAVMPPARAWHGIREKLGHVQPVLIEDPVDTMRPWLRRPLGIILGVVAIVLVVFFWLQLTSTVPDDDSEYQAQLISEEKGVSVTANLQDRTIKTTIENGRPAEDRDFAIWWIGPDGNTVFLGLLAADGRAEVPLPDGLVFQDGVKITLSEEPKGSTQTDKITGLVVAVADLRKQ